ncbi:gliding motility-associated C-terminal domain-containing protein [Mucilaginibacter sp. UYCu711]|uniref:gliding motility-associated C-terminal domain-containing protein n=1 Tax=Mucilaginibacter sp. UYCu711 TaxID=3156339 RepID=UPI003D241F3D
MAVLLTGNISYGQVCSGSLGDPIVNITFGAGTGNGPALGANITNLGYTTSCPTDGQYMIVNQSTSCYTDNWHIVTQDHTGDTNGRFMLINAQLAPNDFYVQRVDNLCGGTTYQFAAWALNMVTRIGNNPNITFSIEKTDGTPLNSVTSGAIPVTAASTWRQYAFYFTIPAGVSSVVIRMRNNAPGGLGNDLAIDDITFRPAGPAISVGIQGTAGTSVTVCPSASSAVSLFANAGACYLNTAYQWQQSTDNGTTWANVTGASSSTYQLPALTSGTYLYRAVVAEAGNVDLNTCRVISNPLTVVVSPPATSSVAITASATTTCTGTAVTFTATPTGGGTTPAYQWMINGINAGTNSATFTSTTLQNNDVVSCVLTPGLACSVPATSNQVTIKVVSPVTSVVVNASATATCPGTAVTFTATATGGGGSTPGYQWLINGINAGTNSATFTTATLQNNDVVSCVVTTGLACSAPATSNQLTMKILSSVNSITIGASATTICPVAAVTFTATPTGGGATPAYQWMVNGINAGTNSATFTSTALQNNDVVSCVLTTGLACSVPATSNQVTIKVVAQVTAVAITASATTICTGTAVTFTATPTGGGTTPAYQWMVNGLNAGTNSATFTSTALQNNDVVSCVLTTSLACSVPATSNQVTIKVVSPVTAVVVSTPAAKICNGQPANFTATATNAAPDVVYQWTVNNLAAGTDANTFTSSTLMDGDAIACSATNPAISCTVPVVAKSLPVIITVESLPVISFSQSNYTIYEGEKISLQPVITSGTGATYVWSPATGLDNVTIANPVASPTKTTEYTLMVISALGCTTTGLPVKVTVLYKNIVVPNSFTPNNDGINDTWVIPGLETDPSAIITVFNRYGGIVYESHGYTTPWNGHYKNTPLPFGAYYYVIAIKNNTQKLSGCITIID